jgi:hypothetical protein
MNNIVLRLLAAVLLLSTSSAMAGSYVYPAVCEKSYSKQGEQTDDLTKKSGRPIKCDSVILSLPENGNVLIQISDKSSQLTPLGFGGSGFDLESNPNLVTVPLKRIYLPHSSNPSTSQVIDGIEGFCFLEGKVNIRSLAGMSCVGKIEIGTQRLIYNVQVRITGVGQSVPGM